MKIEASDRAEIGLSGIYSYLFEKWGIESVYKLEEDIEKIYTELITLPYMFEKVKLKDGSQAHRIVVNERTILLYEVDEATQTITIQDAFDARTDWK